MINRITALLLLVGLIQAQSEKLPISLLDFSGNGVNEKYLKFCDERLETNLIESNRYNVIAGDKRDEILKEWEFQSSGVCDEECVAEIGDLLGAKYFLIGNWQFSASTILPFLCLFLRCVRVHINISVDIRVNGIRINKVCRRLKVSSNIFPRLPTSGRN